VDPFDDDVTKDLLRQQKKELEDSLRDVLRDDVTKDLLRQQKKELEDSLGDDESDS
jgi:hypothetical protein